MFGFGSGPLRSAMGAQRPQQPQQQRPMTAAQGMGPRPGMAQASPQSNNLFARLSQRQQGGGFSPPGMGGRGAGGGGGNPFARLAQRPGGMQTRSASSPFGIVGGTGEAPSGSSGHGIVPPPRQQARGVPPQSMQMGRQAAMGGLLSDAKSKEKIRELEGIRERYEALLDTPSATAESFKGASSNTYEYEDPDAPGAAPGRHAGPMAAELRSIPGVVERGPDGMDRVNPGRLSLANASAQGETSREVEDLRRRLAALEDDPDAVLREAGGGR